MNQLSRDVTAGECGNELTCESVSQTNGLTDSQVNTFKPMPVETLRQRIQAIRTMPGKVWWEMTLGIALGVSSFSILFGGSLVDALATLVAGVLLGLFMTFVSSHLSRLVGNVAGGLVGGILCILLYRLAMGIEGLPQLHLANMIIGTIIALVPGVPFTNGMRDLANEDYIAGTTRLTDAFLVFLCIALGVALAFIVDGVVTGGIVQLGAPVKDPVAAHWVIQLVAAFVGTVGFSALFGAPRRYYLYCGLAGMAGWAVYLLVAMSHSVVGAAFFAALAVLRHHPTGAGRRHLLDGLLHRHRTAPYGCCNGICGLESHHRHRRRHHPGLGHNQQTVYPEKEWLKQRHTISAVNAATSPAVGWAAAPSAASGTPSTRRC